MFRLLLIIVLLFTINAFSQNIKVSSAKNGKARISNGKVQSVIDLRQDITGCLTIYDATEPKIKPTDITNFKLLDVVQKGGNFYLLLHSTAQGNCNVQGMCGAAVNSDIIWLKLNKQLRLIEKIAFVLEDCRDNVYIIFPKNLDEFVKLRLTKGKLILENEKHRYSDTEDYIISRFVYNHSEAEKGFTVKTEKRERPKN